MSNICGDNYNSIVLEIAGFLARAGIILCALLLVDDMILGNWRGIIQDLAAIGSLEVIPRAMRSSFHYIDRWRDRMLAKLEEEDERK
jgi:hypothetical protein